MKKDIIIIGAGPAGLTAGYELLKKFPEKHNVYIIEEDKHVGGLAKTVGNSRIKVDIGGHRYFSRKALIIDWWKNILPDDDLMVVKRSSKIFHNGNLIDYPVKLNVNTIKSVGLLSGIKILYSYLKTLLFPLEESSLENFYINHFGFELYKMFFLSYTEKVWGRKASEIAPDWGYQRVSGLNILNAIRGVISCNFGEKERSVSEFFYYPQNGSGYLWETVAKSIKDMGGTILTEEAVTKLKLENNRVSFVECKSGRKIAPAYVISSMAIKQLIEALDSTPERIKAIAQGLEYRSFVIVGLIIEKNNLLNQLLCNDEDDLISDQWIYIQDPRVRMGRIQLFNNWSAYIWPNQTNEVCLGIEYFCQKEGGLWSLDENEFIKLALSELKTLNFIKSDASVIESLVHREAMAYPCYWGEYKNIHDLHSYIDGIENLICIGRNGQHKYNNIDHTMESAMLSVDCLTGSLHKNNIWNTNTRLEYNER